MDFITQTPPAPKNLYPCLATITVSAPSQSNASRRLSTGSFGGSDAEEGNALKRVISGNRRKSSVGGVVNAGAQGHQGHAEDHSRKWYWRVQAGVSDSHLILLPLTTPANPVLTSPPAPLPAAMPGHSTQNTQGSHGSHGTDSHGHDEEHGLTDKIKNLFRRSSAAPSQATTETAASTAVTGEERVLDQTPQGDQLPSPKANATGATNLNANAETGWPGIINGEKLAAITIALGAIDKDKVVLGGGKKDGSHVFVPITSHFSNLVHPMLESIGGRNHDSLTKSGSIKFEFDKEWIGAKAEAELLHYNITSAQPNTAARSPKTTHLQPGGGSGAPDATTSGAGAFADPFPQGQGQTTQSHSQAPFAAGAGNVSTDPLGPPVAGGDVGPDESVSSTSGKVGGTY